jgi:hypothetical protein
VDSLEKVASYQPVNPKHPLVVDFVESCDVLNKLAEIRSYRDEIAAGHQELTRFLTKVSSDAGLVGKAWGAASKGLKAVGEGGTAVGNVLVGKDKGRHVGTAAKGLAVAAPALAMHEAYRRNLEYNPTFQSAKFHTLSAIPGTQEYNYMTSMLAGGGQGGLRVESPG